MVNAVAACYILAIVYVYLRIPSEICEENRKKREKSMGRDREREREEGAYLK